MKLNKLTDIVLDELSLVDDPANGMAKVVLTKNKAKDKEIADLLEQGMSEEEARRKVYGSMKKSTEGDNIMDIEELQAKLAESQAEVTKQKDRADVAEANSKVFEAVLGDAFDVTKSNDGKISLAKRNVEDTIEIDGERFAKSLIPAPVLKRLEASQKEADDLRKAKENEDLRKSAEEAFPNLSGTPEQKTALMKSLRSLDDNDRDAVMASLKAADAAVSKMFKEEGDSSLNSNGGESFSAQLDTLVKSHAKDNSVDYAVAFSEVTKSGKGRDLFVKSRSE